VWLLSPRAVSFRAIFRYMHSDHLGAGLQERRPVGFHGPDLGNSTDVDKSGLRNTEKYQDCAEIRFNEIDDAASASYLPPEATRKVAFIPAAVLLADPRRRCRSYTAVAKPRSERSAVIDTQ
jgi:hypothetical protein